MVSPKLKKEDAFIEKFALFFENMTPFPRIAGKIFSYLLICSPAEQSQIQLIKRLGIAKSSVSTMIKMLLQTHMIDEVSIPGERSRYYKIKIDGWEDLFIQKLKGITAMRSIIAEGYDVVSSKDPLVFKRLDSIDDMYAFFQEDMKTFAERWEKHKKTIMLNKKKK